MHIKIVDYTKLDINKIEALNFIVDSIYDIYKKEKDSLTSEFLNLTPELFIDSQCGHVYSTCSIDVFKLIDDVFSKTTEIKLFVVFELSLDFEGWEGNLVRRYELFFGLFHNHKCSSFILNHKFNKLLIPKFIEYFMYAIDDNINEENIPLHFNEFENINETRSKLIGLCYSKLERVTSLSDFIDNKFLRYWNYDDEKDDLIASFRRMKWISPYYDVEGMYNNTNVLSNDFHTMLSPIESFNKRNKNEYNYTIVIDTETNGLPLDYNETFPYLSYPSPVQISWAIFDEYNNLVEFRDYIIKQNIPITKESTDIHGIDDKIARLKGVEISLVLEELIDSLEYCDEIVGHNIEFDIKVLEKAYWISKDGNEYIIGFINKMKLNHYCTMKESMKFLNEVNISKYPKLSELYNFIFKEETVGLHDSAKDIQYTHDIYTWLKAKSKKIKF